jgi:CheY-like chemotaxis protein
LDDDPDLLEMYREILAQLPSRPEIHTATSGARAMAMLEAEPFRLLISDLRMPKMDGLQVLSIVRRKYPQLRTMALTSVPDEQFRTRAYALGVDIFWHKPASTEEIKMFVECVESLLGRDNETGFRGVQSKSLMDLIQLECMSQSSSVLRITNAHFTGKIWIQDGEVIDAETGDLTGEAAFRKIFAWKTGHFETLPSEPTRARAISKPYNGLLLESAQALDEAGNTTDNRAGTPPPEPPSAQLSQVEGLEFVLAFHPGEPNARVASGLENSQQMTAWAGQTLAGFRALGERLQVGPAEQLEGRGPQRHVALVTHGDLEFCAGWKPSMSSEQVWTLMKKVLTLWA